MQVAQSWALTKLVHKFPKEFSKLYAIERTFPGSRSSAYSRAKKELRAAHLDEYNLLYKRALELGYPRSHQKEAKGG